jgi:hypothetical protein
MYVKFIYIAHLSCKHATNNAITVIGYWNTKFRWENAIQRRWVFSFTLKEPRVGEVVMVGGRELKSVGPKKEKDLSPYDARRARGTRREVVLEDLMDLMGCHNVYSHNHSLGNLHPN